MSATLLPEDDEDVIDMHVARIIAMTPEELRADIIARGEDPDELAAVADAVFAKALADCGFSPSPAQASGSRKTETPCE